MPISNEQLAAAEAELEKVRTDWLDRPGVTAIDIGYRYRGGQMTDELAIRVHVQHKLPANQLAPETLFPAYLGPFPVDVIEANYGLEL